MPTWKLSKKEEFDRVISSGKRISQSGITAWILPSEKARLGFAISKKYGPAVRRNQFKRRVRAIFQNYYQQLQLADVMFAASSTRGWIEYKEIEEFIKDNLLEQE